MPIPQLYANVLLDGLEQPVILLLLYVLLTLLLFVIMEEFVKITQTEPSLLIPSVLMSGQTYSGVTVPEHKPPLELETIMVNIVNMLLLVILIHVSILDLFVKMMDKMHSLVIVQTLKVQTQLFHLPEHFVNFLKQQPVMLTHVKIKDHVTLLILLKPLDTHVPVLEDGLDQPVTSHQLTDASLLLANLMEFALLQMTQLLPLHSLNASVFMDTQDQHVPHHQLNVQQQPVITKESVLDSMEELMPLLLVYVRIHGLDNIVNGTQLLTMVPHLNL